MAEYSIKSEIGQRNKEKLEKLVKDAGFENMRRFCKELNIDQSNLYSNLDGTFGMSMKRMFKIANLLGVHILQIVEIFYPEELAENQKLL